MCPPLKKHNKILKLILKILILLINMIIKRGQIKLKCKKINEKSTKRKKL